MIKTILCFGDSNTWGFDPVATATAPYPRRHSWSRRWTGVLATDLGDDYRVIEEGQNGRTTVHEDPLMPYTNGKDYLPVCLESHKPIDLIVLMLGTNDLKTKFNLSAGEIASGAGMLVQMIRQSVAGPNDQAPKVLLVAPPVIGDLSGLLDLREKFTGAREKSLQFPGAYQAVADDLECAFLNPQTHLETSQIDGLHLEESEHRKLGDIIAQTIKEIDL